MSEEIPKYRSIQGGATDEPLWQALWENLTGIGGLLRVRALLAIGMTVIGGVYLLDQQAMPPSEFNLMWLATQTYYFATRGSSGS